MPQPSTEQHPSSERRPPREPPATAVTPELLAAWPLPPPGKDKNDRGSVLVVGGAAQTPGAVLLAGLAAMRAGAGRLQLALAEPAAAAVAIAAPEARVVPLRILRGGSVAASAVDVLAEVAGHASAVCVGPGLDDADRAARLVARLVPLLAEDTSLVVDAYALAALESGTLRRLAGRLVLTPNPQEAAKLLGVDVEEVYANLVRSTREIARQQQAAVSVYGHTADRDGRVWTDAEGGPGLGTSGSGDVLAGLAAGLLARGADAAQAAVWGTHLHAAAGERLSRRVGPLGYLARELLDEVPSVLAARSG